MCYAYNSNNNKLLFNNKKNIELVLSAQTVLQAAGLA